MRDILIVDDDAGIRELLITYLERAGYAASGVPDGKAMWTQIARRKPALIVLDLMLPGIDGLTLCRQLSDGPKIPVIMLTARGELLDRILGLEMGADDYLPKPFDPRELLARIRVVLRRHNVNAQSSNMPDTIRFGEWSFDPRRNLLHPVEGGQPVTIGPADGLVLLALLLHPYRTFSRDELAERVRGRTSGPLDRSIDMCVSRLRQALGDDARNPSFIRTIRNGGYMLTADIAANAAE
ncbi:response regulator transcription factor [Sphingomonadaceae bacterium jetA1]|jgi:two-component system OmpR family response regulator|uniref:response regulator n=1 Tax=Facivitalis istanbulensis TaxID=3075838 RepID=UPI00346C8E7E